MAYKTKISICTNIFYKKFKLKKTIQFLLKNYTKI